MKKPNKISRKKFFRYTFYLLGLPVLFLWQKLIDSQNLINSKKRKINITSDLPNGTTIQDELLIHKNENEISIFSARCTHLGCKITKFDSEGFICPCHGSRYDFNGKVTTGPSYKSLAKLSYTKDMNSGNIVVEFNE